MIKFLSQVAKLDLLMFLWHYKTNKTKTELIITSRFEVELYLYQDLDSIYVQNI